MHLDARADLDAVPDLDVLEDAEEAIAMPGDSGIATLVGQRHAGDEPGTTIECEVVVAIEHRHFELERRYRQHRDRLHRLSQRSLVVAHPARGPQALVRRLEGCGK